MKFEEKMLRLEEIARLMKDEGVSFEEQIKLYQEGAGLSKDLEGELKRAEQLVEEISLPPEEE